MGSSVGGQAGRNAEKVTRGSLQSCSISVGDSPTLSSSFWPAACLEPFLFHLPQNGPTSWFGSFPVAVLSAKFQFPCY